MDNKRCDIVVIGGSAGCMQLVTDIVGGLKQGFSFAVLIVLHRMRNVSSDLTQLLESSAHNFKVCEPDDKDEVRPGCVYLAPQNYHLLIEGGHFSLDYSEAVMFSRPSIDVSFDSVSIYYKDRVTGILLSGANHDGAAGLKAIASRGGTIVVQDPKTADYPVMPQSAIALNKTPLIKSPEQIIQYIQTLNT